MCMCVLPLLIKKAIIIHNIFCIEQKTYLYILYSEYSKHDLSLKPVLGQKRINPIIGLN